MMGGGIVLFMYISEVGGYVENENFENYSEFSFPISRNLCLAVYIQMKIRV